MQTGSGRVKVSDFGLACGKDQVANAPIGYVMHLPPESIANLGYTARLWDAATGHPVATSPDTPTPSTPAKASGCT